MKTMKKLLSILMVLTLVLSLGATALAAEPEPNVTLEADPGHTYMAYQIFKGDNQDNSKGDNGAIGNLEWGDGIKSEAFLSALQSDTSIGSYFTDCSTAQDVAKAIVPLLSSELDIVAKYAQANVLENNGIELENGKTSLPIGYYVILDAFDVDGEYDVLNRAVLQVTKDVKVEFKADKPSSEKKVKDKNDTANEETGWQDSADYDIGDTVPFQLKATIPAYATSVYETYELVFHDTMDAGLTFDPLSVKVYVNGTEVTADGNGNPYGVRFNLSDGCTFEVVISDVKTLEGFTASDSGDDVITVEYTATLNDSAAIGGAAGNANKMLLEYSNNPYTPGTGKTPEDKVIVFTYDLDVNKIDGKAKPLEGAEFALYKKVPAGTADAVALDDDGHVKETDEQNEKIWLPRDLELKGNSKTTFYSKGLDDGDYKLVEVVTPDGYNTIDPVDFTVTATHDTLADNPQLKNLTGTNTFSFFVTPEGKGEAVIDTNITNESGVELPETGGIGTTIFYVAGALLVAAAVVLLVTKRRVNGAEK